MALGMGNSRLKNEFSPPGAGKCPLAAFPGNAGFHINYLIIFKVGGMITREFLDYGFIFIGAAGRVGFGCHLVYNQLF
jgi:hypothetical protein